MNRFLKISILVAGILCFCFSIQPAFGKNKISTHVKVIHASTDSNYLDPDLQDIAAELETVIKYTSYRLLKKKRLNHRFNEKGRVNLPGGRSLAVTPLEKNGKRIRYQITILKNKNTVFQTRILLKNNSSITIGGPKFKNGYLLFNIAGSIH